MTSTPVKNPKLPITTAYFFRDGGVKRIYGSNAVRAMMLANGHLALDHYGADTVHIYDNRTGDLHWELARTSTGAAVTYKGDPEKMDDPWAKRRKSPDILFTGS